MFRFTYLLVLFGAISIVSSDDAFNDTINKLLIADMQKRSYFPKSYHESVYDGKLSPGCVAHYNRMYVTKEVPPRYYPYFHEAEIDYNRDARNDTGLELNWRIVGGYQVDIRKAPYAVLYGLYCGGTLIAPEWVITAAHCKTEENFIISGSTSQFDGIRYPICAHFLHPKWNLENKLHYHDYDYQLILLENPVPVSAWSRPIAIGNVNDIKAGQMITVSGWGHSKPKQKKMQNAIRQVLVPIIPHVVCQALPDDFYKTITPRMFCAGFIDKGGKDSCQGDSGGPAVVNNKLVGLVSFGIGCAEINHPGVYTDIPLARDWIREVTGLPL